MMSAMTGTYLFDLGNTRLKIAPLHADGEVGAVTAIAHDGDALGADWTQALPARFEAAVIASVASPALRVALLDALTRRCGRMSIARTLPALGTLRIAYPQPESLGVDRFLALLGARTRIAGPALVVGVGTAITIDLVDADGRHHGGRIAPSPALMREALHARAAQLPDTGGVLTPFADNTPDALQSGCEGAALALIDQALRDAADLLAPPGRRPQLIFHGGGAESLLRARSAARGTLAPGDTDPALFAPGLVLEGLAVWARTDANAAPHTPGIAGTCARSGDDDAATHTMPPC